MHSLRSISMLLVLDKNLAAATQLPTYQPSTAFTLHTLEVGGLTGLSQSQVWFKGFLGGFSEYYVPQFCFLLLYSSCTKSMGETTNFPIPPIGRA